MKRIKKAILLPVRTMARHANYLKLYDWAEIKLFELRTVYVMPRWYYHWLYNTCLRLAEFRKFQWLADRAIHTIPYRVRFEMAQK